MKEGMKEEGGKGRIKRKEEKKEDEGRRMKEGGMQAKASVKPLRGGVCFFGA